MKINFSLDCFEYYLSQNIVEEICEFTNKVGEIKYKKWKKLEESELRIFIGLLTIIGVLKSKNEDNKSLWNKIYGRINCFKIHDQR